MHFFSQLWEIGLTPQLNPHLPPTPTCHPVCSPTATTITAVTSVPIHSRPRLQCFLKSYLWPMQGSWGEVATHPLLLLFISVATGHQLSFQSAPYSPMSFLPVLPVQAHVTASHKSWLKSYHCMYNTGIVVIFVCLFVLTKTAIIVFVQRLKRDGTQKMWNFKEAKRLKQASGLN